MASVQDALDAATAPVIRSYVGSQPAPSATFHRTDIDGLRALAVTAVICLHAGVAAVSGGFLGVDVFFVISGYLIHKDLTGRLHAGAFAPLAFYGRRMRRTLPALYFVTICTLGATWFVFLPGDFDAAARSAAATALSVSNFLFLGQVGYFDHDALSKPLLHTWSLGVEEQFYLFAPLISLALFRVGKRWRPWIYVLLLASTFALCMVVRTAKPAAAFYMMPPRAWEFLLGCAVADGVVPAVRSRFVGEALTTAALSALVAALFLVAEDSAHPGLPTLVPCLATAAIIHTGGTYRSFVARCLGAPPIALVGLMSYSLYLWHWPLLALARYLEIATTPALAVAFAGLLLAVSILSWRYVERPFRAQGTPLRRRAGPILAGGLISLLVASGGIVLARGVPDRFPADVAKVASYYDYADRRQFREGSCFLTTRFGSMASFDKATCLNRSDHKPNYLLIGDSLAAHLWIGLSTVFPDVNILQATASGCKPTLDTHGPGYCVDLMTYALRDFLPKAHLDGVVMSGNWVFEDPASLAATVTYAKRYTPLVVVLGMIPVHDMELPNLLARSLTAHRPDLVLEHQLDYTWDIEAAIEQAVGPKNYMSLLEPLCPARKCVVYASPSVPLQFDKSHLTSEGSVYLARQLKAGGLFVRGSGRGP
jgi:peptidoglycan/LPS O-acetylase OafA/YrhL